jgi:hypothetical protein
VLDDGKPRELRGDGDLDADQGALRLEVIERARHRQLVDRHRREIGFAGGPGLDEAAPIDLGCGADLDALEHITLLTAVR